MKNIILIIVFLSAAGSMFSQEIKSYNIVCRTDIANQKLNVKCDAVVDFKKNDSISLVLWKYSKIDSIYFKNYTIRYNLDTISPSPVMYIPEGAKLNLYKPAKFISEYVITFVYQCDLEKNNGWARSFTEEWIELNLYSGWFPILWDNKGFTSHIKFYTDSGYIVTGSGIIKNKDQYWDMNQPWTSFDNVIIASKGLKLKVLDNNNAYIEIVYEGLSENDADMALKECNKILNFYESIFGLSDSSYLKFVFIPYMKGGYGRKNFYTLRTTLYDNYTKKGIAHEMAHSWWHNAGTTTWEDWLNEAFAEYSMLLYIRETYGWDEYHSILDQYRKNMLNAPPVWGIDRDIPEAYTSLYEKGSVILSEMENKTGSDIFRNFLQSVLKNNIETTEQLLILIEKEISEDVKIWLEDQLKHI